MKYIFKQIDTYTPSETTVEFTADTLSTVLEQFEMFLRGSGFVFDGNLDFVQEDDFESCGNNCADCECGTTDVGSVWNSVVDSLNNPPSFRAADLTGKNS